METPELGPRHGGWRRPVSVPADLAWLRGPAGHSAYRRSRSGG